VIRPRTKWARPGSPSFPSSPRAVTGRRTPRSPSSRWSWPAATASTARRAEAPLAAAGGGAQGGDGAPEEGVTVRWTVESGDASFVTTSVGTTDAQGLVSATVQLGPRSALQDPRHRPGAGGGDGRLPGLRGRAPGAHVARRAGGPGGDTLRVRARASAPPGPERGALLRDQGPGGVGPGGRDGREVHAASRPVRCRSPRSSGARQRGLSLAVADGGQAPAFVPGEAMDVEDATGFGCVRLREAGGTSW